MSAAVSNQLAYRPAPVHEGDDKFVALAADLGAQIAPRAAMHDRENTFVHENFRLLKESGYARLAVPAELGGLGASMRQVCYAQAELAKYCGSTALAVNMHLYVTLANVYRWRHGATSVEGMLRRVASDGLILMTSGGSDGIWPSATAVREDGGYRVTGRKTFCSQAPVANLLTTATVYDDPQEGMVVLAISVPVDSEGFQIVETWDTLGMRSTSSHDVQLNNVFVSEAQVAGRRPLGRVDVMLRSALVHITPPAAAVYYGVAAGARDEALRVVLQRKSGDGQPLAQDTTVQRQVGLMDFNLRTAWWSLLGALDELGENYEIGEREVNLVQMAKRSVLLAAQEVVDVAMEVVGGASYFKRSPLERAYRDVRAGKYHPFSPERVLLYAGRSALALPVDRIW